MLLLSHFFLQSISEAKDPKLNLQRSSSTSSLGVGFLEGIKTWRVFSFSKANVFAKIRTKLLNKTNKG